MNTFPKADNRLIIGIGHKARQGKDTAATFLSEKYGSLIVHFADALYEECRNAQIIFRDNPAAFWLKPKDEPWFHFSRPPQVMVDWIKEHGYPKNGLPFNAELYFGGMKEKDGTLLQFWGTEFRRKCYKWNYWVDKVRQFVVNNPENDILVPDTRFINEAELVKELGGIVWKVDRPGFVANDRDPNHPSEIELNDWGFDEVLVNDGSISDLHEKTDALFRLLKGIE